MKEFALQHPFISAILFVLSAEILLKISSRFFRLLLVAVRGWPPPHLDADGDWRVIK